MKTNIVIDISPPMLYLAKFWFSVYGPKCCWPIKLQDSLSLCEQNPRKFPKFLIFREYTFGNGKFLLKLSEINFHIYRNNCKLCGKNAREQEMKTISKYEKTIYYIEIGENVRKHQSRYCHPVRLNKA